MNTMKFADFCNCHGGKTVVVCGCGVSLQELREPERSVTIGVNDVGRLFTPDYLLVANDRRQFAGDRYHYVERSQAKAVFSQLELNHPRAVRFRLGTRGGTRRENDDRLHYTSNSPYLAVNLARHMGASRIGLIGVDFHESHFFGFTGPHPLAGQLAQIDEEYGALAAACRADGIELVNLSCRSRLTSLPRASAAEWLLVSQMAPTPSAAPERRIFFVHYRFLSCGTVFDTGLQEAAQSLGITAEHAYWDAAQLPQKVTRFRPDLLFVVHGRRFVQRWGQRFAPFRSAVWLLDEPYEVDDTEKWSNRFDLVFLNDPATLQRHQHAHPLPVAYTPALHYTSSHLERYHQVGFIGGGNPAREQLLGGLARRDLLDYVVGGPWKDPKLNALSLASNVPAEKTAALYRETTIVVNVFRDRHHFNCANIEARSMNPRICEALACGALVISEPREELARCVPELPTFRNEMEASALIEHFLANPSERIRVQLACAGRLADATYAQRLRTVMEIAFKTAASTQEPSLPLLAPAPTPTACEATAAERERVVTFDDDWDDVGCVVRRAQDGSIVIETEAHRGPGRERGLASRARFDAVDLTFEACWDAGVCLVAKVHQASRTDQSTNSYHLYIDERRGYLARHHCVFHQFELPRKLWTRFRLVCGGGLLSLWRNDRLLHRVRDNVLTGGFAFIGAQGGSVRLRSVTISPAGHARAAALARDSAEELVPIRSPTPRVSIITTVYDRADPDAIAANLQRVATIRAALDR
jgi:hypothetical protein